MAKWRTAWHDRGAGVPQSGKHIQKAEEAARRRNYDFAVQLYQQILRIRK